MLAGLEVPPAIQAELIASAVLADLGSSHRHRGDPPAGVGKSTLVAGAAVEVAAAGDPLIIIAQTNEQAEDLIDPLTHKTSELRSGRQSSADYKLFERFKSHETDRVADLGGPAAKWAAVIEGSHPSCVSARIEGDA
ncbi:hypothetical protein [Micromonospora echinofusca]|uniref:hypothetical protein n=1 Tax=Micromonospora echinofusca TaxID=47858 RepID=UPI003711C019